MRSTSQFGSLALKNVISGLGQQILGICLYLLWGIKGLVMGINIGLAITVFISLYLLKNYIFEKFRLYPLGRLVKFSSPYYIEAYLHYFRNQGDQLIIGAFLNPVSLSTYYIAKRLFESLYVLIEILNQTMTPALSKATSFGRENIEKIFTKISCLFAYFFIPLSFLGASLSYAFANLVGGEKYMSATVPAIIFCFAILLYSFYLIISMFIFVLGKPAQMLKFIAFQSFSVLLFLILLIQTFGIIGAALSQLIAVSATLIYGYFALRRLMMVNFDARAIINSLLAAMIMVLIISFAQMLYFKLYLIPLYISISILIFFSILVKMLRKNDLELIHSVLPIRPNHMTKILYKLWPSLNLESRT
jgi:O-antigen/teichoic acid export membrane protein